MATWEDLRSYIAGQYKIEQDLGGGLKLLFNLDQRSQIVFVTRAALEGGSEEWAVIESPVGRLGQVDLTAAAMAVGNMVCGGISVLNDELITLRHSVPLANLDVNEFERPFDLVLFSADRLESILTGRDDF
jgi:hypothetical protein